MSRATRVVFSLVLTLAVAAGPAFVVAQQSGAEKAAAREQLEQEIREIEEQIRQYEQDLKGIKGEKTTLQNKIRELKSRQASLNLQIHATNLQIQKLTNQTEQTQESIRGNEARSGALKEQLAEYLRLVQKYDERPFYYGLFLGGTVSETLNDYRAYLQLMEGLDQVLEAAKRVRGELDQQLAVLVEQQDESRELLSVKLLQQEQLAGSVGEQNTLLKRTQGRESEYQKAIKDSQARVKEIRSRIYQLLGVSSQITFGQALDIATWVEGQVGVRAPFLLAVLTQESNLGKNVGTCNRPGDPPEKGWRVIMKPERDHEPFLAVTRELGMNPDETPVSCPMRNADGSQLGWGGAMGPAQFIPSTWVGYKARVEAMTGKTPANPWDIRDAFVAAAILLKSNGANGTEQGEWNAAMRYFSGSTNLKYRFYGDSVLELTEKYESDIAELK